MASDDKTDTDAGELDPGVASALELRFGRTKKAAGREPDGLEEIALYVDGALPAERRSAVEARLEADAELCAVVDELRKLEGAVDTKAEEKPSNVIPLVIPGRSMRVGSPGIGAPGNLRALPAPEPKKNPLRMAMVGIGAALALAAILFLVTRPPADVAGTHGAGMNGKPDAIAIGFEESQAVLEVEAASPGELAVLIATPEGTRAVGLCDAKACLVTNDHVPLRAGKNTARAVIGTAGQCAFVLALTADGSSPTSTRSAAYVDPHAAAKAIGTVVSKESCVLESMDRMRAISGARHIAFMRVPAN